MKQKDGKIKYLVPASITLLRLIAAPGFYFAFVNSACAIAFSLLIFAAITDIADGKIARSMNATSTSGAFFDVITDFIFIMTAFTAFFTKEWYGLFVVLPIAVSFIHFLIGRGLKKPVYDPLGKYTGSVVMVIIGITLVMPHPIVRTALSYFLILFFIITVLSRIRYLDKNMKGKNKNGPSWT